jgi:superfamily I DNA/RNA helicase
VHKLAADLLKGAGQTWQPLDDKEIARLLEPLYPGRTCPLDMEQLLAEWQAVVEAQGLTTWEQYRSASRAGRGRALTIKDRKAVWEVLGKLHDRLEQQHAATYAGLCRRAAALFQSGQHASPFDAVIVDELQDLKAQELLFLAQLAPNQNLMLVGDAGQRIYSGKVTLKTLGIDVRGRSYVLRINYRTTEQIRRFADQLLEAEADDLDGGRETRNETRSLLSGPQPILQSFANRQAQNDFVCAKIQEFLAQGRTPDEIGVFARQTKLLEMLETRLKRAGIPLYRLSKEEFPHAPAVNLGTMHRAKGLEFKIVFVLDVADEYLPTASVLQNKKDEQLREEFIELERQLLYVSVTRARDAVFLTWAGTPSRFLKQAE